MAHLPHDALPEGFPFLIGTLRTQASGIECLFPLLWFPFLIGTLRTREGGGAAGDFRLHVSIPYRHATN